MAEYADIPDKVAQLSDLGAELVEEITLLEDGKSCLDQRFTTSLSHLNRSSSQLPVAVHVLILEKPPVCRSFLTGSCPTLLQSLGLLDAPRGLRTAHSTRHRRGLAADGRPGQASRQEVEDKSDSLWMTFLIPIVNVATTLHSLAAEASPRPLPLIPLPPCLDPASNFPSRERNQLGESYRTAAAAVTAKHTAEKLMDQAKVLDKLEGMEGEAGERVLVVGVQEPL